MAGTMEKKLSELGIYSEGAGGAESPTMFRSCGPAIC